MKKISVLCACLFAGSVNANVVYDNAQTTDSTGGYFTHGNWTAFDSFSVSSSTITSVSLEMSEYVSDISDVTLDLGIWTGVNTGNVFSQSFDLGSSALASYSLIDGSGAYDLFDIALDISDIALNGSYWISVHTTGANGGGLLVPYISDPVDGDDQFVQYNGSSNLRTGQELSFELHADSHNVSEPGTLALLGLGLAGLGFSRKKKAA